MKRHFLITTLLLALATGLMAQVTIYGRVTEKGNQLAIPECQIRIQGSNVATFSNDDGRFMLSVDSVPEVLEISAVGYRNEYLYRPKIAETLTHQSGSKSRELQIMLQPALTVLEDVFVYSAENILLAALDKVQSNYRQAPETYDAFYRETIRRHHTYVSVSEAVLKLYKTCYEQGPDYDQVHLQKGRSLVSQRRRDTLSVHVQGGPTEALYLDLVKNRDFLLNAEQLKLYHFDIEPSKSINNRLQYVISFKPAYTSEEILYQGLIYIDHENLAFTRLEFEVDMSDPSKVSDVMLSHKPLGLRFKPKGLKTVVNYYFNGQTSDIAYMRTTYNFNCDWKKRGMARPYEAVSEMVVTNHMATTERPNRRLSFHQFDVLDKKVSDFDDPNFWKDYNILQPSESLEHAVQKLKKR